MKLTNEQNISLSMAVFLATDNYDYDPRPNSISATSLLKSVRQAILIKRAKKLLATTDKAMDVSTFVNSRFGSAIHDAIEKAWSEGRYARALYRLGYKEETINRLVINHGFKENEKGQLVPDPKAGPLPPNAIPVYMEIRSEKKVGQWIVTGKFDFIGDGYLEDHKTTGVFTYMKKSNDDKFVMQGSIYRWLNPDLVTRDQMFINYAFTDWNKLKSMIEKAKGYPPHRMMSVVFNLKSEEFIQRWIEDKLTAIDQCMGLAEPQLPPCTTEELWQDKTVYKYYKNPSNKTRATRNFDTFAEAQARQIKDGNVGVIDIVKGQAKACLYCDAAPICSQAKQLAMDGLLDMEF